MSLLMQKQQAFQRQRPLTEALIEVFATEEKLLIYPKLLCFNLF